MSENLVEALFFSILALSMIIQTYNYLKPIERAAQKLLKFLQLFFPTQTQWVSNCSRNLKETSTPSAGSQSCVCRLCRCCVFAFFKFLFQ